MKVINPRITYSNPTTTIAVKRFISFVKASRFHAFPNRIKGMLVFKRHINSLILKLIHYNITCVEMAKEG